MHTTTDRGPDVFAAPAAHADLPPPSGPPLPPPAAPRPPHRRRLFAIIGAAVLVVGGAVAMFAVMREPGGPSFTASLDAPEAIVEGDTALVEMTVENTSSNSGERDFTLLADGVAVDTAGVRLDGGAETTVEFQVDGLQAGYVDLSVEGFADATDTLWVMTPPEFVVDDLVATPEEIDLTIDPTVTVEVTVTNIGESAGTHTLELTVDGDVVERRELSLEGGGSSDEVFTLTMDTPGSAVIGAGGLTTSVVVLAPAELTIGGVAVTPNPVDLNSTREVSVLVTASNTGESQGTFTLELMVDGQIVETREVTLAGGEATEQTFTVTVNNPGLHGMSVNGFDILLDAYMIERPANGTVLVNEIGGGSNHLTIDNQRGEDVYVVLTAPGEGQPPLLAVYVHANSSYTIRGLRSGSYTTYFVHGTEWCSYYRKFTGMADYGMFDEPSVFESNSTSYTIITLTFGATDGAWSPTSSVDPDEFPT